MILFSIGGIVLAFVLGRQMGKESVFEKINRVQEVNARMTSMNKLLMESGTAPHDFLK